MYIDSSKIAVSFDDQTGVIFRHFDASDISDMVLEGVKQEMENTSVQSIEHLLDIT